MTQAAGETLYLETTLNGAAVGIVHFEWRGGALWASLASLAALGFRLPPGAGEVRLTSLAGVEARYDAALQQAVIVAPLALLRLRLQVLGGRGTAAPVAHSATGAVLNYNLYGTFVPGGNGSSLAAYTEWRAFGAFGVFDTTLLTQASDDGQGWQARGVRLDTTWSHAFPGHMLTLRAGDVLTGASAWSRATRIGGIQVGTDFSLQPYTVTTPLPAFFGAATLPSEVELYINGLQQYSGRVPAGPFRIDAVPGINGAGQAQIVMTNALGETTTVDFDLYDSPMLLRQGLTDWSAEIGFVREDYGLASFEYGDTPVASATWRRGMSDAFTLETHAEASQGLFNGGVGGAWRVGARGGILSGSVAFSRGDGGQGRQAGLGYTWTDSRYTFVASGLWASRGYRDAASAYSGAPPRLALNVQAGINTRLGSLGLGYVRLDTGNDDSRYASASWTRPLWHGSTLAASLNQGLGATHDRSVFVSLSLPLGRRGYASASAQQVDGQAMLEADAAQAVPGSGGWGWRAGIQRGSAAGGGQAEVDYLGRDLQAEAGAYGIGSTHYAYAGASGALVLMGGGLFPARQVTGGFAVVSTEGVPGVPVALANNPVGTTNGRGLLLVTPLNAYQDNWISIDPMHLPAGVRLGAVRLDATPALDAGTLVRFDITPVRAALVILRDAAGRLLPVGSAVRLVAKGGAATVVGFDGEAYFDTLQARNELEATTPDGTCRAWFDYPTTPMRGIARIGPLTCTKAAP